MNRTADHEVKLSLATQVRDFWMEHRIEYLRKAAIVFGFVALAVFIYLLHRSVAGG